VLDEQLLEEATRLSGEKTMQLVAAWLEARR
jgi:hypothetical protein